MKPNDELSDLEEVDLLYFFPSSSSSSFSSSFLTELLTLKNRSEFPELE